MFTMKVVTDLKKPYNPHEGGSMIQNPYNPHEGGSMIQNPNGH